MLDSVRVRLTLWYTAVLTLVLIALSTITYFIFWRSTVQRTDVNLAELSEAFLTTLDAEVSDQSGPDSLRLAGQVAITEHRFRDHVFAIFDDAGNIVVSSQEVPPASSTVPFSRSEEHTSELQSRGHLVCRLLLEKKKKQHYQKSRV